MIKNFNQINPAIKLRTILISLYFIVLMLIAYNIYPLLTMLVGIWLIIIIVVALSSERINGWWWFLVLVYPPIEILIKANYVFDFVPYSWFWVNRFEHFLWAFLMCVLIYPALKNQLEKIPFYLRFIFISSVVVAIGSANEIFEGFIRSYMGINDLLRLSNYYTDTLIDMIVNIVGALLGTTAALNRSIRNKFFNSKK